MSARLSLLVFQLVTNWEFMSQRIASSPELADSLVRITTSELRDNFGSDVVTILRTRIDDSLDLKFFVPSSKVPSSHTTIKNCA